MLTTLALQLQVLEATVAANIARSQPPGLKCSRRSRLEYIILKCSGRRQLENAILKCSRPSQFENTILKCSGPSQLENVILKCSKRSRLENTIFKGSRRSQLEKAILKCSRRSELDNTILKYSQQWVASAQCQSSLLDWSVFGLLNIMVAWIFNVGLQRMGGWVDVLCCLPAAVFLICWGVRI